MGGVVRDGRPGGGAWGAGLRPLAVAAQLAAAATPALGQFSVQPVIVELGRADTAETATITARNEGRTPLELRVYAAAFDQAADGSHTFLGPEGHSRACAGRLSISPGGISVRPGERQQVRIRMEPGAETCWSVVFVEHRSLRRDGIWIGQRIGVKVYGVPGAATRSGEVVSVSAPPGAADAVDAPEARGRLRATVEFRNTGTAPLRPRGRIEVRRPTGELVQAVGVEAFSALPGHTRRLTLPLGEPLPSGRYLLIPILDFGGEYLAGGQAVVEVP